MTQQDCQPIFIVGSLRSGTTLLRLILDSHPHISCGPETHFLIDLANIATTYQEQFKRFGHDPDWWYQSTADFFQKFQMEYADRRGKKRWAEKTPGYTLHMELLDKMFPTCQFIHIIRNGRDVVESYQKRWGYLSALKTASHRWRNFVTHGRTYGQTLPKDRYYELRYEALVTDTEPVLRELFDYLQEPWVPDVLNYEASPHDIKDRHAETTQKFQAESAGPVYNSRVGKRIDPILEAVIRLKSGQLLKELDY